MEHIFMILSLVTLSGLSLFALSFVVNAENQQVPEKVKKRDD